MGWLCHTLLSLPISTTLNSTQLSNYAWCLKVILTSHFYLEYFIFKYKHIIGNFVCKAGVRKVPHFVTSGSHVDCLNLLLLRVPFPRFMLLLAWYSRALTLGELSQISLEHNNLDM